MPIRKELFGEINGEKIYKFVLENNRGFSVKVMNYGATITDIIMGGANLVYGYGTLDEYVRGEDYVGATVGRFANRIGGAEFEIDCVRYELTANDFENQCHGGIVGFNAKIWAAEPYDNGVKMTLFSPDGDENYPGNLTLEVDFEVSDDNALKIHYFAKTDKKTPINFTNHAYFNLSGRGNGKIFGHYLWLDAGKYLEIDEKLLPTGNVIDVSGTDFDFRKEKAVTGGFDHCFVFAERAEKLPKRAVARDTVSDRRMELFTDMPCVQLYTANTLEGAPHEAFCLETQFMPDSMHHAHFTNCILSPGENFESTTTYKFYDKGD